MKYIYLSDAVLYEYKYVEGKLLIIIIVVILRKTQCCTRGTISAYLASPGCKLVSVSRTEGYFYFFMGKGI